MARKTIEFTHLMDGKAYKVRLYDKFIPEDLILNWALHYAATLKLSKEPSLGEMDQATKMRAIDLNLEI